MKEIALIKVTEHITDYDTDLIAQSITDWSCVSDEEYKILYDSRFDVGFRYVIIERMSSPEILDTVKQILEKAKQEKEKKERSEQARKEKEKKYLEKAKLAKEKRDKKKFELLKAKFEKDNNG